MACWIVGHALSIALRLLCHARDLAKNYRQSR
jgi:hypothetical protein